MTYRQTFDCLGNPRHTRRSNVPHKLIQRLAWTASLVFVCLLAWVR